MDLKDTYNRIAEDWAKDHNSDGWWNEGTDKFLSLLSPKTSILDVGCGAGIKSKYLKDKGFDVTGIDFSEKMIEVSKKRVPSADFYVKDILEVLNFSKTFDGVFAQAVLLHIPKKEIIRVVKNVTEPLKVDGYLYIAVKEQRQGNAEEEVVKENDYGYEYERFFSYFTLPELTDILSKTGMELVYESIKASGNTNWIQVIAKKN